MADNRVSIIITARDMASDALRRLGGRVQVNGSGASKRVAVYNRWTLQYLGSGKTRADGTWEIKGLPEIAWEEFFVVYLDDTRSFDPVAFDNIALEF